MSTFVSGMRGAFLYLSRQPNLRRFMETSAEARILTSRFIAGLDLEDGLRVVRELDSRGVLTSLDHLGTSSIDNQIEESHRAATMTTPLNQRESVVHIRLDGHRVAPTLGPVLSL